MAGIANCRRCGKMYGYNGKPICPACVQKEEEDFEKARDYIKENPGCGMREVADETGVTTKLLTKFLREKRIEFADGSDAYVSCETCGAPISSGRYCNNCLGKLGKEMMGSTAPSKPKAPEPAKKEGGGMHISKLR